MLEAFRLYHTTDKEGDTEQPTGDFGPYSTQFMFETGARYINHGLLPFPGAWVDQPQSWVDALHVWLAWREYTREDKADDDAFEKMLGDEDGVSNWQDVFGERG